MFHTRQLDQCASVPGGIVEDCGCGTRRRWCRLSLIPLPRLHAQVPSPAPLLFRQTFRLALQFVFDPVADAHLLNTKIAQHPECVAQILGRVGVVTAIGSAIFFAHQEHIAQGLGEALECKTKKKFLTIKVKIVQLIISDMVAVSSIRRKII